VQSQVSLVTPTLNAANTLPRTLQSALNLRHQGIDLDHWVIDGGSTDTTVDYVKRFCKENDWCKLIQKPGLQIYQSMNLGLAQAEGHFCHVLNADDFILKPSTYANLLRHGIENNAAVLIMGVVVFKLGNGQIIRRWQVDDPTSKGTTWRNACKKGFHVAHPGFIALSSLYKRTGFSLDYPDSADYMLMQSLLLDPELQEMVETTPELVIGMASGGKTSRPSSILRGIKQLKAINKELGIQQRLLKRYFEKSIEILRCQIWGDFLELPNNLPGLRK